MSSDDIRPTVDADGHLDPETIAGLDAAAFDPETTDRLSAHVASCGRCSAQLQDLRALRQQLADLPAPQIPASVAARIEDAIRAEQRIRSAATPLRAVPPPPPAGDPSRGSRPGGPPPPAGGAQVIDLAGRRRRTRILAAAAGVAVIAVGVGVAVGVNRSESGNGHNVAGDANAPTKSTTGNGAPNATRSPGVNGGTSPDGVLTFANGDDLEQSLATVIRTGSVGLIRPGDTSGPAGQMADPKRRAACLGTVKGANTDPVAIRRITFQDKSSYVFVLPSSADPLSTVRVVVVPADCGQSPGSTGLGGTLFDDTAPR